MQSETSIFIENLNEIHVPDEHKQFAASSHKQYGLFIPIRNQQRQVIGLFQYIMSKHIMTPHISKVCFVKLVRLLP